MDVSSMPSTPIQGKVHHSARELSLTDIITITPNNFKIFHVLVIREVSLFHSEVTAPGFQEPAPRTSAYADLLHKIQTGIVIYIFSTELFL
jgi:hypothetical protein